MQTMNLQQQIHQEKKISKELVINDELRKNTIKIDISIDENTLDSNGLALKGNVKIDYGNNSNLK